MGGGPAIVPCRGAEVVEAIPFGWEEVVGGTGAGDPVEAGLVWGAATSVAAGPAGEPLEQATNAASARIPPISRASGAMRARFPGARMFGIVVSRRRDKSGRLWHHNTGNTVETPNRMLAGLRNVL